MGWSHPDISLEDLLHRIKGFVDILVLASGYQSSGLPAIWDTDNIKMAMKWGLFFEDVLRVLHDSDDSEDSIKELDAVLLDLTSNSHFPKGLAQISSTTLSRARNLVLGHLLHTHPLKDSQLITILTAIIELDIECIIVTENDKPLYDTPNMYLDKFMVQMESLNLIPVGSGIINVSSTSSATVGSETSCGLKYKVCDPRSPIQSYVGYREHIFVGNSFLLVQEILKRRASMSCTSSLVTCLDTLTEIFAREVTGEPGENPLEGQPSNVSTEENAGILTEVFLWNQWKSKCLSYILSKRVVRLLSGANMIFSAPKVQWVRVFEPLKVSTDAHNVNLLEILEISLLGFISRRWNFLIEYVMSHSFEFLSIFKEYSDLQLLLQGNSQCARSAEQNLNPKEKDILEYITPLLVSQPCIFWQLPAILAAAMPSWSILLRIYLTEIERQFTGASSPIRCCDCNQHGKDHRDCEVAERIRCLHLFHIKMVDDHRA